MNWIQKRERRSSGEKSACHEFIFYEFPVCLLELHARIDGGKARQKSWEMECFPSPFPSQNSGGGKTRCFSVHKGKEKTEEWKSKLNIPLLNKRRLLVHRIWVSCDIMYTPPIRDELPSNYITFSPANLCIQIWMFSSSRFTRFRFFLVYRTSKLRFCSG